MGNRVIPTEGKQLLVRVLDWEGSDSWYVECGQGPDQCEVDFSPNKFSPGDVQMDVEADYSGNNTFFVPLVALAEVLRKFGWTCSPPVRPSPGAEGMVP